MAQRLCICPDTADEQVEEALLGSKVLWLQEYRHRTSALLGEDEADVGIVESGPHVHGVDYGHLRKSKTQCRNKSGSKSRF